MKEIWELSRLRTKILRRRGNSGSEVGCGVPGPAGIVEDGAGESDEIGIPGADNGFSLLKFSDQAHGNDRNVYRRLNCP